MPDYSSIQKEETLKAQVFQDFFGSSKFLYRPNIDNIDFVVMDKTGRHVLWAESKKSVSGVTEMFVQLILTIGKARTFDKNMPPKFLAAFDNTKFAFLPYIAVHEIFYQNDFTVCYTMWRRTIQFFNYDILLTQKFINLLNDFFFCFSFL